MQVRTVGDLVAALQQMPQDLPVLAGTHYDNDRALTNEVYVDLNRVFHLEAEFHDYEPGNSPMPGSFQAVTIA